MTTHKTLAEARVAAKAAKAVAIAEIEHRTEGRCYIAIRTWFKGFEAAVKAAPDRVPDIVRLYGGHELLTAEEADAARREALRTGCKCERCGAKVDGNTAYSQEEWGRLGASKVKARAFYCGPCARLLHAIGAGEHSEMEDRAASIPSYEPETYRDY